LRFANPPYACYPEGAHDIYTTGAFRLECLDMALSVEDVYADVAGAVG